MEIDVSSTTVTPHGFACELVQTKKAAGADPVGVTDQRRPTYALPKIDDDCRLSGQVPKSLLAVMDAIRCMEFEFEPPTLSGNDLMPADFG